MRRLALALQTGETQREITGFSVEAPAWLDRVFETDGLDADPIEQYQRLEPELEDDDRPHFYVFTDLSGGGDMEKQA